MRDLRNSETRFLREQERWGGELEHYDELCCRCCRQVRRELWREDSEVILAEAHYQLLLLLREFDPAQGVPLAAYLARMLPQRMINWVQKERLHQNREKQNDWQDYDDEAVGGDIAQREECCATSEAEKQCDSIHWWRDARLLLTSRQQQVMNCVLRSYTERQIAELLGISGPAVHHIKSQAQKKLRAEWKKIDFGG